MSSQIFDDFTVNVLDANVNSKIDWGNKGTTRIYINYNNSNYIVVHYLVKDEFEFEYTGCDTLKILNINGSCYAHLKITYNDIYDWCEYIPLSTLQVRVIMAYFYTYPLTHAQSIHAINVIN